VVNIYDKGRYPLIALPLGIDLPADVDLKPSEFSIPVLLKRAGPFARHCYPEISLWLHYGGIESESLDTEVSAGIENVLISLHRNSYPPFIPLIDIA